MSRVRTGHKPSDWSLPDGGANARPVFGFDHGGYVVEGGALVQGTENEKDRQRRFARESKARAKAREQAA